MKKDQGSVLALLGLELESMDLEDGKSISEIARGRMHLVTAKKYLKYIYYCQNFVPRIDLFFDKGTMKVQVKSLPSYLTNHLRPRERLLLKLLLKVFNKKLTVGSTVPVSSLKLLDDEEEALDFLESRLFSVENQEIGLTSEGVAEAWKRKLVSTEIRDSLIQDFMNDEDFINDIEDLKRLVLSPIFLAPRTRRAQLLQRKRITYKR